MHFLIVEDRAEERELIALKLRRHFADLRLTEVLDADTLRQAMEQDSFDLVLTDYALGWMDGLQVLHQVKERFPDVPVVMFTESGNEEVAAEGMRTGLSDYLLKKHLERLPAAIQGSLERARLQRELDRSRRELEVRVQERTAELAAANATLQRQAEELRSSERALRESQARLEAVFAAAPDVLLEYDTHGRVVRASKAALEVLGLSALGWTRDQAVKKLEFKTLDGRIPRKEDLPTSRALRGERVFGELYAIRTADGSERIVSTYAAPFDQDGQVRGVVALWHDVTERQRAEEALQRSNRRLGEMLESIRDGFFALDRDWRFTYINERAARNVGRRPEELVGQNLWEQFSGIRGTAHEAHYRQAMDEGVSTQFEISGVLTEPSYEIRVYPSTEGVSVYWIDITERKQAEEQRERLFAEVEQAHRLSETLNRVNTLLGSSLDVEAALPQVLVEAAKGLHVEAGVISRWEDECWKMQHGYGVPDTLLGREFTDTEAADWVRAARNRQVLVVDDTQQDPLMHSESARAYGMRSLLVVPLLLKEHVVGVMAFASRSNPAAFGPAQVDFGWKLATALSLTLENARLYDQTWKDAETRATLLREVNHRVKNNLAAIIGLLYAQMDRPGVGNQPAYQAALQEVTRRIEGLSIVHGMLSASQWKPLRLDQLAERIVSTTLQAAPAGQIAVEVLPSTVLVSPDQAHTLALIINELALNVGKHALRTGSAVQVSLQISMEEGRAVLIFRDNGPGYPEEVLAKQQVGVGLGLLRNLVARNLRGELILRNEKGAVAEIRFPLTPAASEEENRG